MRILRALFFAALLDCAAATIIRWKGLSAGRSVGENIPEGVDIPLWFRKTLYTDADHRHLPTGIYQLAALGVRPIIGVT